MKWEMVLMKNKYTKCVCGVPEKCDSNKELYFSLLLCDLEMWKKVLVYMDEWN